MIEIRTKTNLMVTQIKPAALRLAAILTTQKYDIECASLIGSFLGSCGVTQEEMNNLTSVEPDTHGSAESLTQDVSAG